MLCLDAAPKEKTTKMRYRGRRRKGQRRRDTTANDRWRQQKKGTRWRNQGFDFFQQNGVRVFSFFLRSITGSGFQKPPVFMKTGRIEPGSTRFDAGSRERFREWLSLAW
ncbi:uncharacterized protein DS421_12g362140 [Arachis hypogaea]|nr:uncharacterized protein DS421_12g362140 [Arachis hypogaea]